MYDNNVIAFLSYITEVEYNLIVAEFSGYPYYELRQGYNSVDYFGPPIRIMSAVPKGAVNGAPIYYKTAATPLHKLVYLTQKQINFLKTNKMNLPSIFNF